MSIENALAKVIEDAAKKVENRGRAKPQPLDGGYRGEKWYDHLYSKFSAEDAYPIVVDNIKTKTFSLEPEIAIRKYKETYGIEFKSPTERASDAQRAEIERLKAENEALRIAAAATSENKSDISDSITAFTAEPGLSQEAFKPVFYEWHERTQGRKPSGVTLLAAWRKYSKKNENAS
ncbi:MAG: hypothetical protein WC364_13410 [Eubacteriales bacterium]|jgi:hypothetical protein